jgi:hypothetical protein
MKEKISLVDNHTAPQTLLLCCAPVTVQNGCPAFVIVIEIIVSSETMLRPVYVTCLLCTWSAIINREECTKTQSRNTSMRETSLQLDRLTSVLIR